MSVIDRIIACKTFILSKLWDLANLIIVNEKKIKIIDRIVLFTNLFEQQSNSSMFLLILSNEKKH